jgi:hypothetical protein
VILGALRSSRDRGNVVPFFLFNTEERSIISGLAGNRCAWSDRPRPVALAFCSALAVRRHR